MDVYAYAKKRTVFTDKFITDLSAKNRESRIARYPETAQFVAVQADFNKPTMATVRRLKLK
jgi:hypothetical protein